MSEPDTPVNAPAPATNDAVTTPAPADLSAPAPTDGVEDAPAETAPAPADGGDTVDSSPAADVPTDAAPTTPTTDAAPPAPPEPVAAIANAPAPEPTPTAQPAETTPPTPVIDATPEAPTPPATEPTPVATIDPSADLRKLQDRWADAQKSVAADNGQLIPVLVPQDSLGTGQAMTPNETAVDAVDDVPAVQQPFIPTGLIAIPWLPTNGNAPKEFHCTLTGRQARALANITEGVRTGSGEIHSRSGAIGWVLDQVADFFERMEQDNPAT